MFSSNTSAVSGDANYIEDVFSTYLYTGNGSTQTITNGIDLSTKGGLVWAKMRSNGSATGNVLFDTARGASQKLETNTTGASSNWTPYGVSAFGSTGFTVADDGAGNYVTNNSGVNYASWTFRKQPKFFDVVTYTGNGSTQNISHNLGSVPGCIIVKEASAAGNDWQVYHRSTTNTCGRLFLNLTNAENANGRANTWGDNTNPVPPTSTVFTVGNTGSVNNNGATFVAYLFAHNAGGFGLTGTDNVISCGSYTGNGSTTGPVIDLGYEPQWLLVKRSSASGDDWILIDNMRGFPVTGNTQYLNPNNSLSESSFSLITPTATGFQPRTTDGGVNGNGSTYIYIAIRRGPMKVPTTGTSVFTPSTVGATNNITVGFPADTAWFRYRNSDNWRCFDRLRSGFELATNLTDAEGTYNYSPTYIHWDSNSVWNQNLQNGPVVDYFFRRAPSFFDEVCYTGTGSATTVTHNLGVAPELLIVKRRSAAGTSWATWVTSLTADQSLALNTTDDKTAVFSVGFWGSTFPTASVFTVGSNVNTNSNAQTYVAYLFATCAGVSKVGSYTGTGTTLQVNCGFTGGARFVLIKRTDSTGDWYVWDTARGIVSGNDPYLLLNSTAAEVTNTDYIDTYSAGFEISSTAPAAINASGGTFIFLAIA